MVLKRWCNPAHVSDDGHSTDEAQTFDDKKVRKRTRSSKEINKMQKVKHNKTVQLQHFYTKKHIHA